jgi:hypothetical protein
MQGGLPSHQLALHEADIRFAVKSFQNGSADGTSGLRPQLLNDTIDIQIGRAGVRLTERPTMRHHYARSIPSEI